MSPKPVAKRLRVELFRPEGIGTGTFFTLPFAPAEVFGAARAKVRVTIGGHTYRTTVAIYGGVGHIVVNEANRVAANVRVGDVVDVLLERDDEPRVIEAPKDLAASLRKNRAASERWKSLSYTHRKEHVEAIESAKRPETRARRIDKAVEMLASGPTSAERRVSAKRR